MESTYGAGDIISEMYDEEARDVSENNDAVSNTSSDSEIEEFDQRVPRTALTVWEGGDSFYPTFISEENEDPIEEPLSEEAWHDCPIVQKADLLYQFIEDSDPKTRVAQFFAQCKNNGFNNINDYLRMNKYQLAVEDRDPYNDDEAEMKYLTTKPTCFIILGKTLNGNRNLARRLAEYWGSIVIDAESIVAEEVEKYPDGAWGTWLNLTMMKGEAIEPDRIFELIYEKIHSPEARHVGYVLVGVPMVPSIDAPITEECTSQLDQIVECDMFPDVIINVTCPENDLYYLRNKLRYDHTSGIELDYQILERPRDPLRFSLQEDKRQEPYLDEWEEYEKENNKLIDASVMHHCFMTLPHNWIENLFGEVWYYHMHILPYVEKAILGHDQKYVIKLDGRTPSYHMMEVLKSKLDALPLVRSHPVVMMAHQKAVDGLVGPAEGEGGNLTGSPITSGTATAEEDAGLSISMNLDKAFVKLSESKKPGPRFRWHWSTWGKRCPVTSTKFNDVEGKAEYACRFMDKIYFMASEEACKAFTENPRPYLTVVEEHLPDRIFVAGPRLSGKTSVVNHIAETLGAKVFDMKAVDEEMLNDRPVKRATSSLARMVFDTLELVHREALLNYLFDTYAYHYSLVMYINHYSNVNNINDLLCGVKTRAEIPPRDLVYKDKWFEKYMSNEEVPVLLDYIAPKEEYLIMIDDFAYITENPIARDWRLSESDRANTLAEKLRLYEGEGMVDLAGRVTASTNTWIVDNAPMGNEFWKYLEIEGMLPNRVIFLHDETEDYEFMISKFVETDLHHMLSENKREALERAALELAEQLARERVAREAREAEEAAIREAIRLAEEEVAREAAANEVHGEYSGIHVATTLAYGLGSPFPKSNEQLQDLEKTQDENNSQEQDRLRTDKEGPDFKAPDNVSLIEEEIRSQSYSSVGITITNQALHSTSLLLKSLNLPMYEEYCDDLASMYGDWLRLKRFLIGRARTDTVLINSQPLSGLLDIARERTNAALLPQAREKSHYEKTMERTIEHMSHGNAMVAEDGDDGDEALRELYYKMTSLVHFGDTNIYCPVALHNYAILYPGKEQYTCVYRDKTYLMSSRQAEEEFLSNPTEYVEFTEPVDHTLFAPRICVVGPIGSGKTTLAKMIANMIKCNYFNFEEMMEDKYMQNFDTKIGRKYEEERVREVLGHSVMDFDDSYESVYSDSYDDTDEEETEVAGATSKELADIFTDNDVMRNALRDYLVLGKRIPTAVLDGVIYDNWFSEPVLSEGMVLDGFPSRPSDIEYMKKRFIVPNLIIHLEVNDAAAVARVFKEFMDIWRLRQAYLRAQLGSTLVTSLIDSDHESEEAEEGSNDYETNEEEDEEEDEVDSVVSEHFGLEPQRHAVMRITENIKFWVSEDNNFLRTLQAYARTENIRWTTLPGKQKVRALLNKSMYAIRTANCLEKCHRIRDLDMVRYVTHEEADGLIKSGYHILSKFGHWCPVQVYEEEDSFPMYRPSPVADSFPVIYRKHIYYLSSLDNLYLFESNPQKYAQEDSYFPLIGIRVAIIGPPKSGKTTLARRLAAEFGLRVVSPGDALRYVLTSLSWCDLARRLNKHMKYGRGVSADLMVEAMEAFIMEEKCVTGGFIYDGFPNNQRELDEMENIGILPMIVLHIDPDLEIIFRTIKREKTHTSYLGTQPYYSDGHMTEKITQWFATIPELLNVIRDRYQNVFDIAGALSNWYLFEICKQLIDYRMLDIQSYDHTIRDGPHSLRSLCVTQQEFDSRLGPTAHYCIVCWATKNQLITEGYPPPAHGLIQFKDKYYFLCAAHQEDFLRNPNDFFNFEMDRKPPNMPSLVENVEEGNIYANGLCIVTYVNNKKPTRVMGKKSLAVKYGDYVYLFADENCRAKFLENPELFCGRKIRYQAPPNVDIIIPPILPLGYLEQSVARIVSAAVGSLVEFRPSMSRLNMELYSSIYVGLQLLSLNPQTDITIKRWARGQIRRYQIDSQRVKGVFHNCRLQLKKTTKDYLT